MGWSFLFVMSIRIGLDVGVVLVVFFGRLVVIFVLGWSFGLGSKIRILTLVLGLEELRVANLVPWYPEPIF